MVEGHTTIIIFNQTIEQDSSHGNGTTRKIRVVVHTLADFDTSGWINVTCQKGEDIILRKEIEFKPFLGEGRRPHTAPP